MTMDSDKTRALHNLKCLQPANGQENDRAQRVHRLGFRGPDSACTYPRLGVSAASCDSIVLLQSAQLHFASLEPQKTRHTVCVNLLATTQGQRASVAMGS